jgi:hypothetical protein
MLFDYALKYKARKGMGKPIHQSGICKAFFETSAKLAAPEEVLRPTKQEQPSRLELCSSGAFGKGHREFLLSASTSR